jgi:hypothetical protein
MNDNMKLLRKLDSTLRLHTAAMEKREIYVYMGEEEVGRGLVDVITDTVVNVDGHKYIRTNCKFFTK